MAVRNEGKPLADVVAALRCNSAMYRLSKAQFIIPMLVPSLQYMFEVGGESGRASGGRGGAGTPPPLPATRLQWRGVGGMCAGSAAVGPVGAQRYGMWASPTPIQADDGLCTHTGATLAGAGHGMARG